MSQTSAPAAQIRFPRLRPVDIQPYEQNGEAYFLLQDPLELNEGSLLVPQSMGPLLALCDGSHEDGETMRISLRLRFGLHCQQKEIDDLLLALDAALLLDNERADDASRKAQDRFRRLPARSPALAGISYPADAKALTRELDRYVAKAGIDPALSLPARGLFSPHIDFPRGGHVYAPAWKAATHAVEEAELIILVGTDHYGNDRLTLTRQSYATPYGLLPTRQSLVEELCDAIGEETLFRGELRHRREHALELVAIWLHYIRKGRPVDLLPVLCGSLHDYFGADPGREPSIRRFLEVVTPHARRPKTLVVASGDLAHVGPAFGGAPLTDALRKQVEEADHELMGALNAGDADRFFTSVSAVDDRYNVCGVTPGYLALTLLGESSGQVLAYDSCAADSADRSAVTICSAVLS